MMLNDKLGCIDPDHAELFVVFYVWMFLMLNVDAEQVQHFEQLGLDGKLAAENYYNLETGWSLMQMLIDTAP